MAPKGRIKQVFPGGNTAYGFHSFYEYVIGPEATRLFVIKGGPGVGKSTFMRQIGLAMVDLGFNVEFHQCSSDNGSLDGVVIPAIGVALVDGTAPHVVDPQYPGCVDEIIHLGDFWDEAGMRANRAQIVACTRQVGRLFARAYRFLRAAKEVHDDWEAMLSEGVDFARVNQCAAALRQEILGQRGPADHVGRARHLFASAITPEGPVHHLETIMDPLPRQYVLSGDPGTGKSTLLEGLCQAALACGFDVECYHCALDPSRIEHLVIPALEVGVTTAVAPHVYTPNRPAGEFDLGLYVAEATRRQYAGAIAADQELFQDLLSRAVACIKEAKTVHDLMETYYIPNMDFAAIGALRERVLQRILGYAREVVGQIALTAESE